MLAGVRQIYRQGDIDKKFAEKEPAASLAIEQQGVFADPAESRLLASGLLQYWRAVNEGTKTQRADLLLDAFCQLLQAFANQLVVVAAQCIT